MAKLTRKQIEDHLMVMGYINLQEQDLQELDLSGADLRSANLSGANLSRANLNKTALVDAFLLDVNLSQASLVGADLEGAIRKLKAEHAGEIEVAGPTLAHSLTELGLIDEYRLYLHPVVVGQGKRYFAGPRPPLRLAAHEQIDENVLRLTYVPA